MHFSKSSDGKDARVEHFEARCYKVIGHAEPTDTRESLIVKYLKNKSGDIVNWKL